MTRDQEGVHSIANTDKPHRVADIVFVHGLKGASHSTWTHQREGHADYFFWPEELGKKFPLCGVWSVGYAAGLTEMGRAGMLIKKRAQNLVSQFCVKGIGERPVIFICHSMGGLVVKALVVAGATPIDEKHSRLVKNIRGILFCGTPHRGSALASFASRLGVAQKHVKQMRTNDEPLDLEHQQFANWHKFNPIPVLTLAESHPMKRQTWYGGFLPRVMIVPRASANLDLGPVHDVEADHLSLVKPRRGDYTHEKSVEWISEIIKSPDFTPYQGSSESAPRLGAANNGTHPQASFTEIYAEFSAEKEESLKNIQKDLAEGHYAQAESLIRQEMAKRSVWSSLPASTKAKAHRLLISAVLNRQLETTEAKKLLWEAKVECPNERFVTSEAFIAVTDGSEKAMLEIYPTPVSEEEWRWKLLLLVNDEQYEEAVRVGLDPASPYIASPAVHGVLCWAYLGLKRLDDAHSSNEIAFDKKPNDLGNLEARALIAYASAISPESSHWLELGFPQPIEPICVLSSPAAQELLAEARNLFSDLASRMDEGSIKQLKYLSWSLAACCCLIRENPKKDIQLVENAVAVFTQIQKHHPYFPLAVHWALQAKIPINLNQTEELLQKGIAAKKYEALEALIQLYLHEGRQSEAAEILDNYKQQYAEIQGQRSWRYYRIQLARILDQKSVVESILAEVEDEEDKLRLIALSLKEYATGGDSCKKYLNSYIALWQHTQKAVDLFAACEAHAELDAPEFVVAHRDALLNALPTPKALLIVLDSLNKAHQWDSCLETLQIHKKLLKESEPMPFLIVEFEALYQTGNFSRALAIARQIAHLHPLEQNIFLWFDSASKAGDHEHMVEAARFAILSQSGNAGLLLHMSENLVPAHPELARQLLGEATSSPKINEPHAAARAFLLSHRLGITDLAPEVIQAALSPGGPVKAITFEQTVELIQQKKEERTEQEEHYRLGNVFVHAFANSTGHPISAIYYDACPPANTDYFAPPTRLWSAGIRHGRRFEFEPIPESRPWKLHLDISSLLLAQRLGVLSVLEKSDAVFSTSKLVPGLLLEELKRLNDRQPSRELEIDHLLALIDAGKIRITSQAQIEISGMTNGDTPWAFGMHQDWRQAFSKSVEEKGVVIDFWPLRWDSDHKRLLDVPEQWLDNVGGPSGLVHGMIEAGWIERSEVLPMIENYDTFNPDSPTLSLTDGKNIFLDSGVARVLVSIGILDTLVNKCKVWLTYSAEREYREAKKQALYRNEISESVESLQKHMQAELGRRYLTGPASTHEEKHRGDSLLFRSLLDLTAASRLDKVIIVAEDRWLTGFLHIDNAPIVGLLDVLHWLHKDQKLSTSDFYRCLHRLRLGNARFIPITDEELLFRLRSSTNLHTLELHETPEIEVIRRYYAACFLDAKSLQLGGVEDLERSEIRFLTHILNVTSSVLADLWMEDGDQTIRNAKSSWLLHALVSDFNLVIQVANPKAISDLNERSLDDLFCLFCARACILRQDSKLQNCIGDFANWLIATLHLPPSVLGRFYAAIENLFSKQMEDEVPQENRRGVLSIFNKMVMGLLKVGRNHFTVPPEVKKKLGIVTVTSLGELGFERNEFWNTVELAMAGQATLICSQNEQRKEYRVTRREENGIPRVIFDDGSENPPSLAMEILYLLSPIAGVRMDFLQSQRANLDLNSNEASPVFEAICETKSPADRVDKFCQVEEASSTSQFKRFFERHRNSQINFGHIENEMRPLGVVSLLKHVGLMPGDLTHSSLVQLLADSALRLIEDHGLQAAFVRQASLPVQLPDLWAEQIFNLAPDEFNDFVQEIEPIESSPLLRFQLACLLLRPESSYHDRGSSILAGLIDDDAKKSWSFFCAVLQWSWRCLVSHNDPSNELEIILCAWLHAGVFQYCLPRPTEFHGVVESFEKLDANWKSIFEHSNTCPDLAHPLHFSATWLLAHALPNIITLAKLPQVLAVSLKSTYCTMLFPPEGAGLLDNSVMVLRGGWTNYLGSFLKPSSSDVLKEWVTDDQHSWLDQESLLTAMQKFSQDLSRPATLSEWALFNLLSSFQTAPEAFREALRPHLDGFSFANIDPTHELASGGLWTCVHFIALQRAWYRTDDEEHWITFVNGFLEILEKHNDKRFSEYALDCAWAISTAWNDPVDCAKRFADTVIRLVRRRPIIATESWIGLSRIVQSQKHHIQVHLWPMLAEVRAVGGRSEGY